MISVADAQELVRQRGQAGRVTTAELGPAALGLVLAEDIVSDLDAPPFDKSLMDGFAVRVADLPSTGIELRLLETVMAGQVPTRPLEVGTTTRVMTGAPLPAGTEAVVMHERTEDRGATICFNEVPKPGQNVMRQGAEMKRGQTVLRQGTRLRPIELGILASVGRTRFQAYGRPTVAILSTGDEVVEPGQTPGPGQIRNSNASLLAGLVLQAGGVPRYIGIAADRPDDLRRKIDEGLQADVLLLSGGVSAGQLDLVPKVLGEAGVMPCFHKLAMKPGKPVFFGTDDRKLVFGLPGNPVSCRVGFDLLIRPALGVLLGRPWRLPLEVSATLTGPLRHRSDRPLYQPARLSYDATAPGGFRAEPIPWRNSSDQASTLAGQGWLVLPAGEKDYAADDRVPVIVPELDLD